ncbi:hypothetical protein MUK42_24295 [Musa troglodytarum]|uniref:Uncharacterized protein n=1 Tax=Musa troglodytarum TaxID=320322 RepID=A0A9E7E8E7_9LILI|nr:hypothetical protein MUK42_24295 [Musa troglodytarum]
MRRKAYVTTYLHHKDQILHVHLKGCKWEELLLSQYEGALQVVDTFKTVVGGGLHEPHAIAGTGDFGLAGARLDDAAGDGVVRDESPGQRRLDGLCRLQAMLEDENQVYQDPDHRRAVHGGEREAA